ncbi:High cysteine membrane protein [Giardia muris]|uniref:High cysteine membrane protein n=1 Tax=Giardia muris TaxID=5742 RepID=A0A4Z1SP40_GIAMU|nr:High cysteine membrane protein [Giardia muris]|eukprot:TNJ27566.1 High cysteine membrane protein [Giardia muris]
MLRSVYLLFGILVFTAATDRQVAACGGSAEGLVCNGHGSCGSDGVCNCELGFSGDFCELTVRLDASVPTDQCNYGGNYNNSKCNCRNNYSGQNCEKFTCTSNTDCYNGGHCYREDGRTGSYCVCPKGYSGADCYVESCSPTWDEYGHTTTYCNNGGTCQVSEPSTTRNYYTSWCECRTGFNGTKCETYACSTTDNPNLCPVGLKDDSGDSLELTCVHDDTADDDYCGPCPSHRGGLDCGIVYCGAKENGNELTVCNDQGRCVMNTCLCKPGYAGDTCEDEACTSRNGKCGKHGTCIVDPNGDSMFGYCECNSGYTGSFCDKCDAPLKEHYHYIVVSDGKGSYNVWDNTTVCAETACVFDGTVCNNAGSCVFNETINNWGCQCDQGFEKDPNTGMCVPNDGSCSTIDNICGGQGVCEFNLDIKNKKAKWQCLCRPRSMLDERTKICVSSMCFSSESATSACSGRGDCTSQATCACFDGYAGTYCSSCADGYRANPNFPSLGLCLRDYCLGDDTCGGRGTCIFHPREGYVCECDDDFFQDPDTKRCVQCQAPHCLHCGTADYCMECMPGYYAGVDGVCKKCDPACVSCTGPGSKDCLVCAPGTVRTDTSGTTSGCGPECSEGGDCNFCGAVIGGSKYCSRCSDSSSYPLDGVCTSSTNSRATNACETIGDGVCTSCNKKYFLHQGGCYSAGHVPGSEVCAVAAGNGSCSQCNSGFYQGGRECTPCGNNCAQCTSSTNCQNCTHGFFLQGGSCVGCHESCVRCSGPGADKCIVCKTGYFGQFLANGGTSGSCRSCSDTKSIDGLAGQKGCSMCRIDLTGESPAFLCLDPVGKGLSGGAIAAIVIVVLVVVGGIAGFCIYWFLFRNKTKTGGKKLRSRTADDTDYVSLMNTDDSGAFI